MTGGIPFDRNDTYKLEFSIRDWKEDLQGMFDAIGKMKKQYPDAIFDVEVVFVNYGKYKS